jgi:hypothetical protein
LTSDAGQGPNIVPLTDASSRTSKLRFDIEHNPRKWPTGRESAALNSTDYCESASRGRIEVAAL